MSPSPIEIRGYASVFGNLDSQQDRVMPGAFLESIATKFPIPLLWHHYRDQPIGQVEFAKEDDHGLYIHARIIRGFSESDRASSLIKEQCISGLSIGYQVLGYEYEALPTEQVVRSLYALDLWEVSIVTFPANQAARITSFQEQLTH